MQGRRPPAAGLKNPGGHCPQNCPGEPTGAGTAPGDPPLSLSWCSRVPAGCAPLRGRPWPAEAGWGTVGSRPLQRRRLSSSTRRLVCPEEAAARRARLNKRSSNPQIINCAGRQRLLNFSIKRRFSLEQNSLRLGSSNSKLNKMIGEQTFPAIETP